MRRIVVLGFALGLMAPTAASNVDAQGNSLSFFITSTNPGKGGDLGGIAGADAHCAALAKAAGAGNRQWRAYLSTDKEHAKDRIGSGPWFNAKGVQVAANVADLHSDNNKLSKENSLTEKGATVNGRGDTPNTHDILTGSGPDGRLPAGATNCNGWTSNGAGAAQVGHHDRQGGGQSPNSWNSAHASSGCSQANLVSTGGAGLFYCFAQ